MRSFLIGSTLALSLCLAGLAGAHLRPPASRPHAFAAPDDKQKGPAPSATPAQALTLKKDFKAELLYSRPKDTQGSWVNMTVDPKGRLIVSDQYGPLYRITPPPLGGKAEDTKVEKLPYSVGGAHGLLWAFDSLYVMVNETVPFNKGKVKPK